MWGLEVYRKSESPTLSLWSIFKILVSSVLAVAMKFLGPIVIVRREIRETVLPEGASVDAVVRVAPGLRIEPLYLGISRTHMADDCKAKAVLWLSLSLGFGAALAAVKVYSLFKAYRRQAMSRQYAVLKSSLSEEWLCSLCMDNPRDLVLVPCHHVCICQVCSAEIVTCPICRRRIDKRVPILMA